MNRPTSTLSAVLALALSTAGCSTLAAMMPDSQLGEIAGRSADAVEAKAPEKRTEFPEAAPLLKTAAKDFAHAREGHVLRSYFTQNGWNVEPHKLRGAPVVLFTREKAKGVSQGAEGEDSVCYEYSCAMVQEWGPGWSAPSMDCNNVPVKVTCKSANALP
jgi:hypothetical protein